MQLVGQYCCVFLVAALLRGTAEQQPHMLLHHSLMVAVFEGLYAAGLCVITRHTLSKQHY
jgi:hypothetical protein